MFDNDLGKNKDNRDAFLVGVREPEMSEDEAAGHLDELVELARTMGAKVTGSMMVALKTPQPRYLFGSGKTEEIVEAAKQSGAKLIIVDRDLSPAQQRNWEGLSKLCVIDRQEVILEIFAARASTREAVLQVALARMEYSLPRLKRAWTHLSRQRGGALGTRGEGETQLEADRRIVLDRVANLKRELKEVAKHRDTRRSRRERTEVPIAAIVGYTNVGKSSLLRALTQAEVLVENKLFATLDPTTRQIRLPDRQKVLLTDTVGFIRKLPHNLVAAFKSTLEEATLADIVIHVMDASSRHLDEQWQTTSKLLEELGAGDKPHVLVYNKIDLLDNPVLKARLRAERPDAVFLSAKTGEGVEALLKALAKTLQASAKFTRLRIPAARYDAVARLYEKAVVLSSKYEGEDLLLTARLSDKNRPAFKEFITA